MNIPLNIDWQQILLHLFNFAILTGGLYLLLYKPVKGFMDKRIAYYKLMDDEAKAALEKAKQMEAAYKEQLVQADAEISQNRAKAAIKAEQAVDEQIKSAKKQAEKIIIDAQESAKKEREKILAESQQDIARLAADAAEKIVNESLDSVCDQFLAVAEGGAASEKG